MWYIYMLLCRDGSLYSGITTDPARRFREHCAGTEGGGAKYTKTHKPVKIAALWQAESRSAASKLEAHLKRLPRAEKLLLTQGKALPELTDAYLRLPEKDFCK